MLKKIVIGFLFAVTSALFGMSLNQLNTASKSELMQIKGIGDKKADAIIKERKKGKFKSYEDLERVKGIGPSIAKNVKNDVKVKEEVKKSTKKKTKKTVSHKKN